MLVFHQLRLELRRARVALLLYGLVLFCHLAVTLGWIGAPTLGPDGRWDHGSLIPVIALIAYWVALASVVASCIVADSPARRNRFLATRPLPAGSLVTAKLLFLLLAVVLPAVLIESLCLASTGADPATIVRGALEHFLLCGSITLAVAAFAAHWQSVQGFILAAIVGFVAVMVLARLADGLLDYWSQARGTPLARTPTFYTIVQGIAVLAAGLALTAWVCSRRGVRYRFLVPALVPVVAAAAAALLASPLRAPAFRPADQGGLDRLVASGAASARIVQQGYYFNSRDDRPDMEATVSLAPRTAGFPDDLEFRWDSFGNAWTVAGEVVKSDSGDPRSLGQRYIAPDAVPVSWALARTIQDHLGAPVLFRLGDHGSMNHSINFSPGSLSYLPDGPLADRPAQVEAVLAGDAFRWTVAADLPLAPGQSVQTGDRSWLIAEVVPSEAEVHVSLSERTVALHTAPEPDRRRTSFSWRTHNRFALYLPDRELVWFGEPQYERTVPRVSGATRRLGQIEFRHRDGSARSPLRQEQLANGARLLILRADYVGRLLHEWSSPEFTLQSTPTHRATNSPDYEAHESWNSTEFALWFHRWDKLDPSADEAPVHAHFIDLFANVERLDRSLFNIREPAIRYAARFVPGHLDFLLAQLAGAPPRTATFLTNAIALGADDSQKETILANLATTQALADVIDLRGWHEDAHPWRVAILRESPNAGLRYVEELLASNDPSLDSLLLDAYRANPSPHVFRALRDVPRLATEAEAITRELWKPGRVVIEGGRYRGTLEFGLLLGRSEALEELFLVVESLSGNDERSWELAQVIAHYFHVPKEDRGRHDHDPTYVRWAADHRPSDFRFDPVLRRFVLKAANSTI